MNDESSLIPVAYLIRLSQLSADIMDKLTFPVQLR